MKNLMAAGLLSLALVAGAAAQTSNAAQEKAEKNVHITEGPSVVQVTGTSAVLKWKTDHIGANNIQYRPVSGGAWKKGWVKEGSIEHWIPMKGLTPNTAYEYQVLTRDGDVRTSGKFETAGGSASNSGSSSSAKGEALKITDGPRVEGTGPTSAVIAWTTNAGGSSIVRYGTDRNSLSQTAQSAYVKGSGHQTHRVHVNGLKPGTTYYFVADSGQGQGTGTEAKSDVSQFTTKK
jgi:phosphodiesterase/alkaline phosphatase D-like protein